MTLSEFGIIVASRAMDWMLDDSDESEESNQPAKTESRSHSERTRGIAQSVREEALRRLELFARTTVEFQTLVHWYDRKEQSRMRRERRYENLRCFSLRSDGR